MIVFPSHDRVVTATAQTDATVSAQINGSNNQTLMAVYKVPSDRHALIMDFYADMIRTPSSSADARIDMLIKPPGEVYQIKRRLAVGKNGSTFVNFPFFVPRIVKPSSEIKVRANVSANTTEISAGFDLVLVENDLIKV